MTDTLGARLAQARRELAVREGRDITPAALAAELDVTPATVYRWESDEKVPRDDSLLALAQRLGVTPSWLRYGQEPKYPQQGQGAKPDTPRHEALPPTNASVRRRGNGGGSSRSA